MSTFKKWHTHTQRQHRNRSGKTSVWVLLPDGSLKDFITVCDYSWYGYEKYWFREASNQESLLLFVVLLCTHSLWFRVSNKRTNKVKASTWSEDISRKTLAISRRKWFQAFFYDQKIKTSFSCWKMERLHIIYSLGL